MAAGEAKPRSATPEPSDPYDVPAWIKYYEENPQAKRSVGAAQADDPHAFTPEKPTDAKPDKNSNRVLSHGELQEPAIQKAHHPKAKILSEKAAGFDFAENHTVVSAHTEQKGSMTLVTERIAGGNWTQLKVIAKEDQIVANVEKALERADNALKGIPKNDLKKVAELPGRKVYEPPLENLKTSRENQFERKAEGYAFRTSYVRKPDQITVHLHFENVSSADKAALGRLETSARTAVDRSAYKADLPPVRIMVTGK